MQVCWGKLSPTLSLTPAPYQAKIILFCLHKIFKTCRNSRKIIVIYFPPQNGWNTILTLVFLFNIVTKYIQKLYFASFVLKCSIILQLWDFVSIFWASYCLITSFWYLLLGGRVWCDKIQCQSLWGKTEANPNQTQSIQPYIVWAKIILHSVHKTSKTIEEALKIGLTTFAFTWWIKYSVKWNVHWNNFIKKYLNFSFLPKLSGLSNYPFVGRIFAQTFTSTH